MTRFFIVAGGTGGHVFPALALVRALQARDHVVTLITDRRGRRFVGEMPHHCIAAEAMMGRGLLRCIKALMALSLGYIQSHVLLLRYRPDKVIGFGGYAALPMVLAAQHENRQTMIHEQNAIMGQVNRLLARKTMLVALAFSETQKCPPNVRTVHVGNPDTASSVKQETGKEESTEFALLVLGGSQGAAVFDTVVRKAVALIPQAVRRKLRLVQQVAQVDPEVLRGAYADLGVRAHCARFIPGVAGQMAGIDLIIARAGGGVTAEASNAGLPALFVPLPIAADNHQWFNAGYYAKVGAAEIILQSALTPALLAERLMFFITNPAQLRLMSQAMTAHAMPNALAQLVEHVEA
ncbi:MAG: UDP-N-acetylglucosamine--N-acetylmuramyl-(pentapeptide) pyrophosphoryl-undecaprenol N-acetylglucosamine transferase [Alphaproteobacteria bacterium]|nr:UDP-N-acetylglucosamine--N-acetylmuramyl-(pentapeptide) pyrophosphoryl-undecaprenol N-acetylglucosamine transferase [Alphaproteobacteria bacterium]